MSSSDTGITVAALLVTVFLVTVSLPPLTSGPWVPGEDEGFLLYMTWRVSLGEVPYRDFFDNQFPNLYLAAAPLVKGLGRRVDVPRYFMLVSFAAMVGGFLVFSRREGHAASVGGIAAVLLVSAPAFREVLVRFRPDVPALALGMLALMGLFVGRMDPDPGRGTRHLVLGCGGLFGLACFVKPIPLYWVPGLVLGFWLTDRTGDGVLDWCLFGAGAGLSLLLQGGFWQVATDGAIWRQAIAANRVPVPGAPVLEVLGRWAIQNVWLFPGLVLWWLSETRGRFSRTWFLAGGFGLMFYLAAHPNTPYPRHLLFTSAAWVYPSALGYVRGWNRRTAGAGRAGRWLAYGVVVLLAGLIVGSVESERAPAGDLYREAEWIRAQTAAGDVVLTDYAGLNYLAGRPRPGGLANVSANLTMGGVIDAGDVRGALQRSEVGMIYLHVYPGAWHLANVPGMDSVLAGWLKRYRFDGLRVVDGRINMVFTPGSGVIESLHYGPRESRRILEPIFSRYGWNRTLSGLGERS